MAKKANENVAEELHIPALDIKYFDVLIIGDSPLIVHAWSDKARIQ